MKTKILVLSAAMLGVLAPVASAQQGTVNGAAGGAVTGAIIGGPVGAAVGGVAGAVAGTAIVRNASVSLAAVCFMVLPLRCRAKPRGGRR